MLKIEYLTPAELKPYARNAKLHPAEQVEQIKRSIQEFGFNDPIAVWGDNTVIEGHGRLIAAVELGLETVPVIRLDGLSDEQRRAYTLVHNKLTNNSGFDMDILTLELEDITEIDMSGFGFEDLDIDEPGVNEPGETSFKYSEQYGVIVMCSDEEEQERIYDELSGQGYICRVVAV